MKSNFCLRAAFVLLLVLVTLALAQTAPEIEILRFKISKDYSAVLDGKPSAMSADNGELPMTDAEILARSNATTQRRNRGLMTPEEKRARGRLHSTIQILDKAEWVSLTLRNTGTKAIKSVTWDFAFPRMEEGKLVLRYEATNQVAIKPGAKKELKQPLPAGAARCKVINAAKISEQKQAADMLCGRGVNDPSQLPETQEPAAVKRIEYADGSVWQAKP